MISLCDGSGTWRGRHCLRSNEYATKNHATTYVGWSLAHFPTSCTYALHTLQNNSCFVLERLFTRIPLYQVMSIVGRQLAIAKLEVGAFSRWYLDTSDGTAEHTVLVIRPQIYLFQITDSSLFGRSHPTRELFSEALNIFKSELSKDSTKSQ